MSNDKTASAAQAQNVPQANGKQLSLSHTITYVAGAPPEPLYRLTLLDGEMDATVSLTAPELELLGDLIYKERQKTKEVLRQPAPAQRAGTTRIVFTGQSDAL